jgi:membrane protein required for colicin V production
LINASENVVKAISFALIIIAVCLCVTLIGKIIEKIFTLATLGWVNRLLGAILSVGGTVLLLGAILSMIEYVNQTWFTLIPEQTMNESQIIGIIKDISETVFPYLKKLFHA